MTTLTPVMASSQDIYGKLVPERQTILDFATARDDGGLLVTSRTPGHAKCQYTLTLSFFTGCVPFLLPSQQRQSIRMVILNNQLKTTVTKQ